MQGCLKMADEEMTFLLSIFEDDDHKKIIEIMKNYNSNEWIEKFLEK